MGTKTIRVREDVYERLKSRKRSDESFSDLLDRLTDRDTQFERGFGALEDVDLEGGIAELDERFDAAFRGPQ
ncbi:MAG: antitoxin VapB family protein [Halorhabdus sp.]